jgi:hypothetical protein
MADLHALVLSAVQGLSAYFATKESLASTLGVSFLFPTVALLLHCQLAV